MGETREDALDAFRAFVQQFGPMDQYNRLVFEVFLEELFGVDTEGKKNDERAD